MRVDSITDWETQIAHDYMVVAAKDLEFFVLRWS